MINHRITLHINGIRELFSDNDSQIWDIELKKAKNIIKIIGKIEDVSIHPPIIDKTYKQNDLPIEIRNRCRNRFKILMNEWSKVFEKDGTTLSIESHITKEYFVFTGVDDYVAFIEETNNIYALLDVAHNHFDGYDNDELVMRLNDKITGLHLSDADRKVEYKDGIHLGIGKGEIDFAFLSRIKSQKVYGAFEVKGNLTDIKLSYRKLKEMSNKSLKLTP